MNMLKFYNTLFRKKEDFEPIRRGKVNLFVCGPTVYDFSHLGHARTYIVYDMLVRYLKYQQYKVFYLQNITDIDDKIIQRAKEKKTTWKEIARKFEKEYLKDMKALNIKSVTKYARATSHIKEVQNQVRRLLKKGYAYEIRGGIYYNIKKFKDYGKLSGRTIEQAEDAVSRIDQAENKRNRGDFCLWKFGEPYWKSSLGNGRPGWHIEDTAITEKYFGPQYDIHGGARDLIFPHHEAEIAQMEALSDKRPMVEYWIHAGFLTVNGQKMSKSLGNFITLKDFLKKYKPEVLRFIVFSSHYRSPLDYSEAIAQEAKTNLQKLKELLKKLEELKKGPKENGKEIVKNFEKSFFKVLEDDFNTPQAKGLIFDFLAETNKRISENKLSPQEAEEIYNFFKKINKIFGFLDFKRIKEKEILPKEIKELGKLREKARNQENWQQADEIRRKIEKLGYKIEDSKEGPKIRTMPR